MYKLLLLYFHTQQKRQQKSFIFPKLFFSIEFFSKPFDINNDDDDENIVFNKSDLFFFSNFSNRIYIIYFYCKQFICIFLINLFCMF